MSDYLTKSNPNIFRLQEFLVASPEEARWTVCKDAEVGDTLFIGLSGKEAGIYATATITKLPTYGGEDPDFWIDPKEAAKPRWRAEIKFSRILRSPILKRSLIAIPELERKAKWLNLQGAACHLTEEEAEAIDRLIRAS